MNNLKRQSTFANRNIVFNNPFSSLNQSSFLLRKATGVMDDSDIGEMKKSGNTNVIRSKAEPTIMEEEVNRFDKDEDIMKIVSIIRNGIHGKREQDILKKKLVQHFSFFEELQKRVIPEAFNKVLKSLEYEYKTSATPIMRFGDEADKVFIILKGKALLMVPKTGIFLDKNDELKKSTSEEGKLTINIGEDQKTDSPGSKSSLPRTPLHRNSSVEKFSFESSFIRSSILEGNTNLPSNDYRELNSPVKRVGSPFTQNKGWARLRKMIEQWYSFMLPVKEINSGESFGEISLLTQSRREATVIAIENSQVLSLNQRIYETIVGKVFAQDFFEQVDFLKSFSIFNEWSPSKISALLHFFTSKTFLPNHAIYKQGDDPNMIYFIRSGEVEITKSVLLDDQGAQDPQNQQEHDFSRPLSSYRLRKKNFKIVILGKNNFFGEEEIIKGVPRMNNAVSKTVTTLLILSREDYENQVRSIRTRENIEIQSTTKSNWRNTQLKRVKNMKLQKLDKVTLGSSAPYIHLNNSNTGDLNQANKAVESNSVDQKKSSVDEDSEHSRRSTGIYAGKRQKHKLISNHVKQPLPGSHIGDGLKTFLQKISNRTQKNRKIEKLLIQKTGLMEKDLRVYSNYEFLEEKSSPSSRSSRRGDRNSSQTEKSKEPKENPKKNDYFTKKGIKPLLQQLKAMTNTSENNYVSDLLSSGMVTPRIVSSSDQHFSSTRSYYLYYPEGSVEDGSGSNMVRSSSREKFRNIHMEVRRQYGGNRGGGALTTRK